MVGQRRGLLAYLKKTDLEGYRALIAKLRYQKIINNKRADGFFPPCFCISKQMKAAGAAETTEKRIFQGKSVFSVVSDWIASREKEKNICIRRFPWNSPEER